MRKEQDNAIIERAFIKLVPAQFISIIVSSVNVMIDSTIIARYLGAEGMASVGLFGPVASFLGLLHIFVVGAQIKGCEFLGRGEKEKVTSVFSTIVVFFLAFGLLVGILFNMFASPFAYVLGASDNTHAMLVDYIRGYSLGIPAMFLMGLFVCFLQINDRAKLSYVGMITMMVINIGMDIASATVLDAGLLGIGLATGLSYLISAFIMFLDFTINKEKKAVTFSWGNFMFGSLGEIALLGLPEAMFTIGVTVKGFVLNRMLIMTGGDNGLAVMNAENTLCCFLSAVPQAVANSTIIMASIFFGQEDRYSFKKLFRISMRIGVILSLFFMLVVMLLRYPLSLLFFNPNEEVFAICERMLMLFPLFLPVNVIFSIFLKMYQAEGRMLYVNLFSLSENLLVALVSIILGYSIGMDGIWLCLPVGEAVIIGIIGISVFVSKRKMTLRLDDWLNIDERFGIREEDELSMSVTSLAEVADVVANIDRFCKSKNTNSKINFHLKLCIEELVGNIAENGMSEEDKDHIDINIIFKDGKYTARIWDTCKLSNPKSQLDQFNDDDPIANIGIKIVSKMADEMTYIPQFGFNILSIVLGVGENE